MAREVVVGEVFGWRGWRVRTNPPVRLTSVAISHHVWQPGINRAGHATVMGGWRVGNQEAELTLKDWSGFYAYKEQGDIGTHIWPSMAIRALGRVALWGRVVEHDRGWRGEYARIVEIYAPLPFAEELRKRYEVPVHSPPVPPLLPVSRKWSWGPIRFAGEE
jgi:hypothetical protein